MIVKLSTSITLISKLPLNIELPAPVIVTDTPEAKPWLDSVIVAVNDTTLITPTLLVAAIVDAAVLVYKVPLLDINTVPVGIAVPALPVAIALPRDCVATNLVTPYVEPQASVKLSSVVFSSNLCCINES